MPLIDDEGIGAAGDMAKSMYVTGDG